MNNTFTRLMGIILAFALALSGVRNVQATPSQQAATGKPVYVYYYLWWSAQHWRNKLGVNYPYSASPLPLPARTDADGCNAVSNYAGNQLLDVPAKLVSQDEPGAIEADIRTAKNAGITGFWLNWNGNGSSSQTLTSVTYTPRLAEALAASNRVGGFKNWVSYKAASMPSATYIINDLNFLYNQFKNETAWERIDGKPVITFTGSRKYSDADVLKISNAVRDRIFLVGDETRATLTPARIAMFDAITYYWSSQDPYGNPQSFSQIKEMGDKVHAAGKRWFAPLAPGYNSSLLNGSGSCVPRRNGDTIRVLWNGNSGSNPDGWGFISWNEIAENSHIKPMQKWGSTPLNVLASLIGATVPPPVPTATLVVPTVGNTDVTVFRPSNGVWYVRNQLGVQFGANGDIPVPGDYNGDGLTDVAVFRPSNGVWYVRNQFEVQWGTNGDIPVPGDYNGDGLTDVAVFRPSNGVWYVRNQFGVQCGANGDIPIPGDYNGDGLTDVAVFRPSNGVWYVRNQFGVQWGTNGDIPIPGDYNGDGLTDVAVFRPSNGVWYVRNQFGVQWGTNGDIPVPGDYNGDGLTDVAVFRPSNGVWYVRNQFGVQWGTNGDIPVPGDYNGDGLTDVAVFRPSNGVWYVRNQFGVQWGTNGDIPIPSRPK